MRPLALALVLVAPALAGCLSASLEPADIPGPLPDPAALGARTFAVLDYAFGIEMVPDDRGRTLPMHLRGSLHLPDGPGPFPVLGFVHGYHGTCSYPLAPRLPWYWGNSTPGPYGACPDASPVVEPAESFRGYDYLSGALASQGYAVLSVDANEQNDNWVSYDWPVRARLLLRALDHLRDANADRGDGGLAGLLDGRLDFERVGIMGHSRGGQAVATAVRLNADRPPEERHRILAVVGLAPVDANSESSVIQDAAYAALLPYCDGDVWNLAGARTYDRSRFLDEARPSPKYQWLVMGTNHNHYNTVWANNANDASWMTDPYCGKPAPEGGFLGLDDTLRVGAALMGAFFRAHVGGEAEFLPLLRGDTGLPAEACPQVAIPCDGLLHTSYHPGFGDRLVLEDARTDAALARNDLGGASRFDGFAELDWCRPRVDCPGPFNTALAAQLHLAWEGPAAWSTEVPDVFADLAGFRWVSVRAALVEGDAHNAEGEPQDFLVVLTDGAGRSFAARASEYSRALYYPSGNGPGNGADNPVPDILSDNVFGQTDQNARSVLNEVRVPLAAFEGVDLRDVREVRLAFEGEGALLLTDLLVGR